MKYTVEEVVTDLYRGLGFVAKVHDNSINYDTAFCKSFAEAETIAEALNDFDGVQ